MPTRTRAAKLLRAAIAYAGDRGTPAIEGCPRPDERRSSDGAAFMGTEELFHRAGFRNIRGVLPGLTRPWAPRVTMRATCGRTTRTSSRSPKRSRAAS